MMVVTATQVLMTASAPTPQLAYGQDGQLKGFAVLEYETAEMAEEAQQRADGLALGGSHLRVSFCAPGPPGRSMLAALIAAQATVSVCQREGAPEGGDGGARGPGGHPLWPGRTLSCSSVPFCRPSIGAKGSCPSPASCSCSATWGPPLPSSCCSTPCSTAARVASRVRQAGAKCAQNRAPPVTVPTRASSDMSPCAGAGMRVMLPRGSWCPEPLAGEAGWWREGPSPPGGTHLPGPFLWLSLPSGSFSFLLSTGLGLCLIDGGVPPGAHLPFSGSPRRPPGRTPGHAAAQRARPVHSAAAARPADPESEGNGRPWATGSLLTSRSPSSFRFQHHLYPPTGGSPSVGLWTIRLWPWGPLWGPACRRCSGLRK